ncbi:uncharacterized protein J3R85_019593, partial [Psidium guajava]
SLSLLAPALTFNVDDFGARGDGSHDDAQAFEKAWKEACSAPGAVLVVPKKNYLLGPSAFSGPCQDDTTFQINGIIRASGDQSDYDEDRRHWIVFDGVDHLVVQGGGTFDGNGLIWWQNSCKTNKALPCKNAPTALTFYNCGNLITQNLNIQNAQQIHVSFEKCSDVEATDLHITAPGNSPNTDGIHVASTRNIQISNSTIGTGDDCISIVDGSEDVEAMDIICGPGHGISIGSLGSGNSEAHVSGVTVNRANFSGTTNGVRIKTWQGGSGSASNIKFQNMEMHDVSNPIIIEQNYCDQDEPCKQQKSAIQVRNVTYQNIRGTSASDVAVEFNCSESLPCAGIVLQNINLQKIGGGSTTASCNSIDLECIGLVSPRCS